MATWRLESGSPAGYARKARGPTATATREAPRERTTTSRRHPWPSSAWAATTSTEGGVKSRVTGMEATGLSSTRMGRQKPSRAAHLEQRRRLRAGPGCRR